MLGIGELKERIKITDSTVECPVKGCSERVERQRGVFKKDERFKCPKHNIYISPSTFEYSIEGENLLWTDADDKDLLDKIKLVKRECRMARDNSEDAVTWNIFRFLERKDLISAFLSKVTGFTVQEPEVIYWSYSQSQNRSWDMLEKARKEFELVPSKGSEPDIMIVSKNALIIIESKLTATNEKGPSNQNVENKYITGGQGWWTDVFYSDFKTVAMVEKKYELSRFWLLGTWMAKQKQKDLDFCLVNLVLSEREKDIETVFRRHIKENQTRRFVRITWEDIYKQILNHDLSGADRDMIIKYFRNKTIGYDGNGRLQRAFSIL